MAEGPGAGYPWTISWRQVGLEDTKAAAMGSEAEGNAKGKEWCCGDLQGLGAFLNICSHLGQNPVPSEVNGILVSDLKTAGILSGCCMAVAWGGSAAAQWGTVLSWAPWDGSQRSAGPGLWAWMQMGQKHRREGPEVCSFPCCSVVWRWNFSPGKTLFLIQLGFTNECFNGCAQGPSSVLIYVTKSANVAAYQRSVKDDTTEGQDISTELGQANDDGGPQNALVLLQGDSAADCCSVRSKVCSTYMPGLFYITLQLFVNRCWPESNSFSRSSAFLSWFNIFVLL